MDDAHHRKIGEANRAHARSMRHEPTDAEKKMWRLLRSRQLADWKFRRQEPMGPYILDLVCYSAGLIIELDGGQHADSASDRQRDAWLAERGLRTTRYWNSDVLSNPEGVLTDILLKLSHVET